MTKLILPPGPRSVPLFGNLFAFRKDPLDFLSICAQEYGDISHFRIANVNAYLLSDPDFIEYVLVRNSANFIKGRVFRSNHLLLGNGLLTSEGDFWRRQRRLAQPAFHREQVNTYAKIITTCAGQMISTWKDGDIHDIYQDMKRLALEIITRILFDVDINNESDTVGRALKVVWQEFTARIQNGLLIPEQLPTLGNIRYQRAVRQLDRIVFKIIQERRNLGRDGNDCLSILLAAQDTDGSQMTDKQLRDEVMTLFIAGHESTALALTWTWYLLAQDPSVVSQLSNEVDGVPRSRPLEMDDLPQLRFTERVVKEAMRLYPPVWAIPRQSLNDCEIGGYKIPAGTSLTISQWVMHRDPRYFPEPDKFKPERWENDLEKRLPSFVYFPFGGGSRHCIAYSLAMVEAVLIIAMLAKNFDFTLLAGHRVEPFPSITLYPRYGLKARIRRKR
jgi:cytochrome P450